MEQKLKQRICIEFLFPNDAPKRTTVFEWHSRFKAGRISIEDDPRQGRPKFQKTDENVQKITDLMKENPRTTLLELEQDTGISKTTIGRIIPHYEKKLCRLATCEDMLQMTRTDPEWKDKIITGDETWVYCYDPETKRQSAEWGVQGSDSKKKARKWTNGDWILHHDNARPHTAHLVTSFLAKNGIQILPQPPYSPDIVPNDFFLFPKLKKEDKEVQKGRHFDTRDDIIEKSMFTLKSIPKEAYKNCFDNWEKRWRWDGLLDVTKITIDILLNAGRDSRVTANRPSITLKYLGGDERDGIVYIQRYTLIQLRTMPAEKENATASQAQLPSMLYNLEKFEGKGIVPFTKFIKDFELVYDLRALDDARKRILLDNHLRGAAREFAFQSQQIRLGYEELKESLERRFRKRVSTREMRSQFFSCRQGAGEKVRDFAARVSDLAVGAESDGLKIGISEVAEVFIDGLYPSLWEKAHLYQGEPWETLVRDKGEVPIVQVTREEGGQHTPQEEGNTKETTQGIVEGSLLQELAGETGTTAIQAQRNPPPPRQERRDPNGERKENPGVDYKKQDARRPPPKCYRCGEPGHLIQDCQQTQHSGSEANIVNIDNLEICTEGLNKPTYLKGITGKSLRSLGSEVLEIGATVNGKPIREVRTTFEYCHMGEIGFDGILGLPGFRALKLHLSYDGSVRSDYERKEDPTKSAFLSSLQTIEMSPQPPRIPLNKIHTGENILRAFSHCFCRDIRDMGNGSTITAPKLKMLTSKPVYRRQYSNPNRLVSKVKTLVDELEEVGIIEGSTSLWNSLLFPVAKTDGSVRITMDLRLINEATEFFPFPIPRIEDNLRAFAGAKVFSTLDLTSGFFQIHIPESDRDYFTFSLPWGRYRFTRLPQGAKNSAQVFQWAMNLVLGDLLFKCVRLYIDDVIVYSDSHEQHVADLAAVLECLSKFGLKAKYGKSYLFRDSVEYLGHVIDQNGIKPISLLGTVNYYRRFIPNAGEVLAPLSNLLRKGHRFAWGMVEQSAFETVKGKLTSEPLLIHPTIGIPFILNTDASGIAVGACLQQEVNGTMRPIAYYSKRLTGPEIRYSIIEKEAYAVLLSLQHFKHLLVGSRVEVHTDHKPITYNKGSDYKNARLSRWAEIIQDFNVTFIYVPGKENTVADFLSRFPCEDDPNLPQDRRVVAAVVRDRRTTYRVRNRPIREGALVSGRNGYSLVRYIYYKSLKE
ncbi:hypothetical protein LAZ67_4002869 [Cordylochernes scorpioides]|uniref:Reverse transcriptase n=1 Tax=Cordylochernes scorpioides TaxID=51811 RepID=A0ABY6KD68_9ARAC|nr:hypothetical protein LAZ67_4002869 [Cordylochernes scorpioides]